MRCTLEVSIWCHDPHGHRRLGGTVAKEHDLPFVPFVGMKVECSAWKMMEEYRVKDVTLYIDPETNVPTVSVFCGQDIMESPEWVDSRIEMYERWGWECTFRDACIPRREGRFEPSARR